jgi:MtN3 and saliva related transmembrane protein
VVYDPLMTDAIGFTAAALTTLSFVRQTRSSGDLSLGMLGGFVAGILLWIIFGLATHSAPVVAANAATLVLASCQIALTLRYRRRAGTSGVGPAGRAKSESTTI